MRPHFAIQRGNHLWYIAYICCVKTAEPQEKLSIIANKSPDSFQIAGSTPPRGGRTRINVRIARLPSGTMIEIPIFVSRSRQKGPTVLLSGGLHGDEVNGIEIVRRIVSEEKQGDLVRGTVIAIPVINIFGFLNFSREVPDGKDVNRSFPGNPGGSLASRVAHFMTHQVLPQVDIGVDFHTGGASRFNFPQVRYAQVDERAEKLAKAFAPPMILQSSLIDKSLRKQMYNMDKTLLVFEGGESKRLDSEVVRQGLDGTLRLLKHLDMVADAPEPHTQSIWCHKSTWVRAKRSGIYTSLVKAGSAIHKKDLLGRITDPFGEFSVEVRARTDGFVIGHNNMPVVNQGDALVHIGLTE